MLLVGLTGGIASGKTLVRRCLEEMGAGTIDADEVSRELVSPGTEAWKKIRREFGDEFFKADGTLDRRRMAEKIFADPQKRTALEAIIHPLIADEIAARIERYQKEDPRAIIVVDAPLMIEVGMQENFDKLVIVYADEPTRIERLMARDGISREEAYRRMMAQMPLEAKLDLADYVIENSGPPEETKRQVMKLFNRLSTLAAG